MFGFVFGTVCLVALFATLRRRHMWGYAHGFGHGHHHHHGFHGYRRDPWMYRPGGFGGQRGRYWLRAVFEQMNTTPGQEKAIVKSIDMFAEHMASGRHELVEVRKQVAQALGGDELDESVLSAALDRVEDLIAKTKLDLVQTLTDIHASLDGKQRKELAELISDGMLRPRYGF
jgi:Spy/CpxP family protein refolding chaperone